MSAVTFKNSKRRYPRINFRGQVVIFAGKSSEMSETLQVSEGGLMAYATLDLSVHESVTVHFTVNDAFVRARAEVVYILPPESDGRCKVGLRFLSLFEEYRNIIRDLAA